MKMRLRLALMNLSAQGSSGGPGSPSVHLNQVRHMSMNNGQALPGNGPFLRVEGKRSKGISVMNSDLLASKGIDVAEPVQAGNRQ